MGRPKSGRSKKKKLIEAGAYWVNSSSPADDDTDLEGQIDNFGLSEEFKKNVLESQAAIRPDLVDFVVLPENEKALGLFLKCGTQWRHSFRDITGLDYSSVLSLVGLFCSSKKSKIQIFSDIQCIETGALAAISERRKENSV